MPVNVPEVSTTTTYHTQNYIANLVSNNNKYLNVHCILNPQLAGTFLLGSKTYLIKESLMDSS